MKKLLFLLAVLIFTSASLIAETIVTNRVAKIGDEIILKSDVEKYAKVNNIPFDEAKRILIEKMVVYTGAKMFVSEPTDEEVQDAFIQLKGEYAARTGKDVKKVTDEEVIKLLNYNNLSLQTFRVQLKRQVWMNKYLKSIYLKKKFVPYFPKDDEVQKFIKDNPALFEEGEGCYLSMIYFSFYNGKGMLKNEEEIKKMNTEAEECLDKLRHGADFGEMVEQYSTDLISKNNTPKGKIGRVLFDDNRFQLRFPNEVGKELKKAIPGVVLKIFKTYNGLYIFRIDEKIPPQKIEGKAAQIKAKEFLERKFREKQEEKIYKDLIEELKTKISYIIY